MRPEAMANGNPLFMNCDFFREHVVRAPDLSEDDQLDTDEMVRMRDHERECKACIEWLIIELNKPNRPPGARPDKRRLRTLRASLTRLNSKRNQEGPPSTRPNHRV